ncbi:MAG: glycosyltransferase family 4 protein [Gammaproteobacteria bacterium]
MDIALTDSEGAIDLIIRKYFSTAKISLLSRLSVPLARKHLERAVCEYTFTEDVGCERQLMIDVSVIIRNDSGSGIQRVVRAILQQLLVRPPVGCRVRPVFATRKSEYCYAPDHFGLQDEEASSQIGSSAIKVNPGDIFLGLDLAAHLLPLHKTQLTEWKRLGTEIHIIVYDLLPVLYPRWFNSKTTNNFHRWLRTIAIYADSVICISNTIKEELDDWLNQKYSLTTGAVPIGTISLGADIESSVPSRGLPDNINQLLTALASKPTVLMVGTLEPRKGHSQILAAFEKLWLQGRDIKLIIIGKPGWKTEALQKRLHSHPQNNTRLYWLESASDEFLELLYADCTGVIVASLAEGFGLPLIEAGYHNKPVLARDIPVLREIGGNFVTFFQGTSTESLMNDIELWLANIAIGKIPHGTSQNTWQDSAEELLTHLGLVKTTFVQPVDNLFGRVES